MTTFLLSTFLTPLLNTVKERKEHEAIHGIVSLPPSSENKNGSIAVLLIAKLVSSFLDNITTSYKHKNISNTVRLRTCLTEYGLFPSRVPHIHTI